MTWLEKPLHTHHASSWGNVKCKAPCSSHTSLCSHAKSASFCWNNMAELVEPPFSSSGSTLAWCFGSNELDRKTVGTLGKHMNPGEFPLVRWVKIITRPKRFGVWQLHIETTKNMFTIFIGFCRFYLFGDDYDYNIDPDIHIVGRLVL